MYLKYGSYTHQLDEAEVQISKARQFNKKGKISGYNETWRIIGKLIGNDEADLTTKIQALEAAYTKTDQNLSLLTDLSGATAHALISSNTATGVKPIALAYPVGQGPEYANQRTYEITVEARYDEEESNNGNNNQNNVLEYSSQVTMQGSGGPQFVVRIPRYGPPIYQRVSRQSPIYISQSGSSLGRKFYPNPDPPMYPAFLVPDSMNVTKSSPKQDTNEGKRDFPINWSYNFILVR